MRMDDGLTSLILQLSSGSSDEFLSVVPCSQLLAGEVSAMEKGNGLELRRIFFREPLSGIVVVSS